MATPRCASHEGKGIHTRVDHDVLIVPGAVLVPEHHLLALTNHSPFPGNAFLLHRHLLILFLILILPGTSPRLKNPAGRGRLPAGRLDAGLVLAADGEAGRVRGKAADGTDAEAPRGRSGSLRARGTHVGGGGGEVVLGLLLNRPAQEGRSGVGSVGEARRRRRPLLSLLSPPQLLLLLHLVGLLPAI